MTPSEFVKANEKIAKKVTGAFEKIENTVTGEYAKIEDAFVARFLLREGETPAQAKERLKRKQQDRQ